VNRLKASKKGRSDATGATDEGNVITWADEGAHWQDRVAQLQEENSVLSEQVVTRFRAVFSFHVPVAGMSNRLGSALNPPNQEL